MTCAGADALVLIHAIAFPFAFSIWFAVAAWDWLGRVLGSRLALFVWRRSRRYRRFIVALARVEP